MEPLDQLPTTEQGLRDYIRFAQAEIKRSFTRIKRLENLIEAAQTQLTIKGEFHGEYQNAVQVSNA